MPKVVYRLIDAAQYRGRKVLVVGGGDSALEAAATLAEDPDIEVSLAYRSGTFSRARKQNRAAIEALVATGSLNLCLHASVEAIYPTTVGLSVGDDHINILNDNVIVCAGGILPSGFLADLGIRIERHFGRDRTPEIPRQAA